MTVAPAFPQFITDNLDCYLEADKVVDWHNAQIIRQAKAVTVGCGDSTSKARALYNWVRDNVSHTHDAGREEVTCAASEVLAAGTGICYAKSHLLAAMLRAMGIPAGFCYQVYDEPLHASDTKRALHGLVGVYLADRNKWIRLDCRGNTNGIDAQFDLETERLAFPEFAFISNYIQPAPLPCVVEALRSWPTRSSLWPNLPQPPRALNHPENAQ